VSLRDYLFHEEPGITLYCGDCREVLPLFDERVDSIVTDPPYSSGGLHLNGKQTAAGDKYLSAGHWSEKKTYPDYMGDNCDQWSWMQNARAWLMACYRLTVEGGHIYLFTDWRQIAAAVTSLQMAYWQYRGIVVWDKGNTARAPYPGGWRHGAEFLLWGAKGSPWTVTNGEWTPGIAPVHNVLREDGVRGKQHVTEKPIEVASSVIRVSTPATGLVLDPFIGSGTTLEAAKLLNRRAIGIEIEPKYCEIAVKRLRQEVLPL
jgi:site-specific DNA-methyltransferase (adenine-specific)